MGSVPRPVNLGPFARGRSTVRPGDGGVQERNTFWVMERARQWIVRHDDVDVATLPSRTHAVAVAMNRAKEDQPSEVLVLGPTGAIEERRTFGEDPLADT
jgi:hypothetical protein